MPVDKPAQTADESVKRKDVGYKRPPTEHQFKKGQTPPARKKKEKLGDASLSETLRKILNEERRVKVGNKVRWLTCADLVIMRAWQEAEKGSAMLRRDLFSLLLNSDASEPDQGFLVITDPDAPASATQLRLSLVDEGKS